MAYSGTPTTYGEQKIAAALAGGAPLTVVAIAVGDGGGSPVSPSEGQTSLTHEVWRGAISSWGVDPADTRRIVVHVTVPATAGPFVVREAGVYDGSGGLICVTALAATEVVGPGSSNQATSIDLIIAMPIGSAGAITVSPTAGERFTIERLYRTPFISINSASTTVPPAGPALGDLYIVPANATGAWATAGVGMLAEWNGTFWAFLAPPLKMVAGIMDVADDAAVEYLKWDGTTWEAFASPGCLFTVVDTAGSSTSDELVGTATPGLTALQPNMIFRWRQGAAANTTTTPHGNVDGFGNKPFTKANGAPLAIGDLPAFTDFLTEFDGTGHRVFGPRPSDILALTATTPVGKTLASWSVAGTYPWTAPSKGTGAAFDVTQLYATVVGAGGGAPGASTSGVRSSGGGGSGGTAAGYVTVVPGQTYTIVVGSGGAGTAYNTLANAGGTSSFGSAMQATGGAGGACISGSCGGGAPGVGSGGQLNLTGSNGGDGNGIRSDGQTIQGGAGAGSSLGGGGRTAAAPSTVMNGVAPGSGAGGGWAAGGTFNGGNGADGFVSLQY